ncbi:MAG: enoyl-CoA hydratase/isomerase family protein [Dehalococcoidia bacterium]|nr:enoyl-CoA hydratase/isomerase family protein [Dehalococcoidia bacterium]
MTKELLYRGLERDIESHGIASGQLLNLLLQSEDHRESVAAFFEKRPRCGSAK